MTKENKIQNFLFPFTWHLEFDFTVVRGLESLHKELGSMKVPLILLGTQDAVKNILTGATKIIIPDVSNENELDELLQGLDFSEPL